MTRFDLLTAPRYQLAAEEPLRLEPAPLDEVDDEDATIAPDEPSA